MASKAGFVLGWTAAVIEQERSVEHLDVNSSVLHGLDCVGDFEQPARSLLRICVWAGVGVFHFCSLSRSSRANVFAASNARLLMRIAIRAPAMTFEAGDDQPRAFRRSLCWMTVINRARRFTRRKLSAKRAEGVRCRMSKTNFRRRLSISPSATSSMLAWLL